MKKILLSMMTGLAAIVLGAAVMTDVAETRDHFFCMVESPDEELVLTLRPKTFAIAAGRQYLVESSYGDPQLLRASRDGELEIRHPAVLRTALNITPFPGTLLLNGDFESDDNWKLQKMTGIMPVNGDRGTDGHYASRLGEATNDAIGTIALKDKDGRQSSQGLRMVKTNNSGVLTATSKEIELDGSHDYTFSGFYRPDEVAFGTTIFTWIELRGAPDERLVMMPTRHVNPPIVARDREDWKIMRNSFRTPARPDKSKWHASVHVAVGGAPGSVVFDDFLLFDTPPAKPHANRPIDSDRCRPQLTAAKLKKQLETMTPPVVKTATVGGRFPQLSVDGEVLPFYGFTPNQLESDPLRAGHRDFAEAGVKLHWQLANLSLPDPRMKPLWLGFGKYDFELLGRDLRALLRAAPEAKVLLFVSCDPTAWFFEKYPQAAWLDNHGKTLPGQYRNTIAVSYTSADYRREIGEALRSLGQYLASEPAGKAVIGVHFAGGQDGQFFPQGNRRNLDHSENFRVAYGDYLRKLYHNDVVKLRAAHGDPSLDFDRVRVPAETERETVKFFLDPADPSDRRLIDANYFGSISTVEMVEHFARSFKAGIGRPVIASCYYDGISIGKNAPGLVDESSALDGIVSCQDYSVPRIAGASGGSVTPHRGSLGLHGKFHLAELDYRSEYSFLAPRYQRAGIGAVTGFDDNFAILIRDFGQALAAGQGAWMLGLSGNVWSHPRFMEQIAQMERAAERCARNPRPSDHAQMAFFIDEAQSHYGSRRGDFNNLYRMNHNFMPRWTLAHSGLSSDGYLLRDLTHADRPSYPLNLFLSATSMTDSEIEFVEKNLQKDGNVLIFITDAGRTAPGGFEKNIRRLTGIDVKINPGKTVLNRYHPQLPAGSFFENSPFTLSEGLGPEFIITPDADTQVLANYYESGAPAAVIKRHQNWTAVYLALPGGFNPKLLRNLAELAKLTPMANEGDVVHSGNGVIAFHATSDGEKTLHWSGRADLVDLISGETVAHNAEQFQWQAKVGSSRLFYRETPQNKEK